jgi:pyruvate kinase
MCLYWGVTPFILYGFESATENLEKEVIQLIRQELDLQNGDKLVITRGDGKFFAKGLANSVRVEIIKDAPKVVAGADTLESVEFSRGKINLDTHICASCQNCVSICPHDIWQTTKDKANRTVINVANAENCTVDMACVEACPTGAIEIFSK